MNPETDRQSFEEEEEEERGGGWRQKDGDGGRNGWRDDGVEKKEGEKRSE